MKELKFPLIGIICSCKQEGLAEELNEKEENYLYTVSELLPIDPELVADCLCSENDGECFMSKKGLENKSIKGLCINNKKSLYAFLNGRYNRQSDGHECYWHNIQKDLYNQELVSKTMLAALEMVTVKKYNKQKTVYL